MTVYIEVLIVIFMTFLLLSLLVTSVTELIASFFRMRSAVLRKALADIITDDGLRAKFYENDLLLGLKNKTDGGAPAMFSHPSYIAPRAFARALLLTVLDTGKQTSPPDPTAPDPNAPDPNAPHQNPQSLAKHSVEDILVSVNKIQHAPLKRLLLGIVEATDRSLADLEDEIAAWYDSVMDRVSGYFKRRQQLISFAIGLILAAAFNVDVVHLADNAYKNDALRAQLVANAEIFAAAQSPDTEDAEAAINELEEFSEQLKTIALGWPNGVSVEKVVPRIPGWVLAALASMLGAPFWFDILSRFVRIRGTGGKPSGPVAARTTLRTSSRVTFG